MQVRRQGRLGSGAAGALLPLPALPRCPPHFPTLVALQVLLSRGADHGAVDSQGRTALAYAMTLDKRETLDCALVLLSCGARTRMPGPGGLKPPGGIEIVDITGESWAHRAVRYGESGAEIPRVESRSILA